MTPEQQRIAISEACPERIRYSDHLGRWQYYDGESWCVCKDNDPLRDLNAMHEAEKVLTDEQQLKYWTSLESTIWNPVLIDYPDAIITTQNTRLILLFSTADQRAEAFLRTIGKGKESCKPSNQVWDALAQHIPIAK